MTKNEVEEFLMRVQGYCNDMDVVACLEVGIEGWAPWYYTKIDNGVIIKGSVFELVTKGKNKGKLNYRKEHKDTRRTVVITKEMVEELK